MRTALITLLAVALPLAGCGAPKITGEEATRVLEQCIMADAMTIMDNTERRSNGNVYTPQMVSNIDDAIAACRLVSRIDLSKLSASVRPCVQVYAIKADVYEAAKPIVLDQTGTEAELAKLRHHLDRMASAERACSNPPATVAI